MSENRAKYIKKRIDPDDVTFAVSTGDFMNDEEDNLALLQNLVDGSDVSINYLIKQLKKLRALLVVLQASDNVTDPMRERLQEKEFDATALLLALKSYSS